MKKHVKKIALLLVLVLVVTTVRFTTVSEAAIAVPKLNVAGKVLNGIGTTYKIYVQNQRAGCKYSWTSSNTKIMTVTAKGGYAVMKAVAPGWTKVSCTIQYTSGTKRVLSAKVLVRIPPTKVEVSNANLVEGVHTIRVDGTYDFNRRLTPSNSSDHTYWKVTPEEFGTIDGYGVFTPSGKIGECTLTATAAPYRSYISRSKITQTIKLNIVEKDAEVTGVELKGADELCVAFTTAMDADSLINPETKELRPSVVISPGKNEKGELALDYGTLTGELSEDKTMLLIRSTNTFNGTYTVCFTSDIKSATGAPLKTYAKTVSLVDTAPPVYTGSILDDSGMKTTLTFNETIDISALSIVSVESAQSVSDLERALLLAPANYMLSKDGRSITIDMSSILSVRTKKSFVIQMQGIKDRNGNGSKTNFITGYVYYDTTEKPQASVVNITRTGYETITVQYTRAIQPYGTGYLCIGDTATQSASVDPDNNRLVHYNIPVQCRTLKGMQTVSVYGFSSYNVFEGDTSSYDKVTRVVNFSADNTPPMIKKVNFEHVKEEYILTLEYTEPVIVPMEKGTIIAKIITDNEDVYNNNTIGYSATVDDKIVKLKLSSTLLGLEGMYTFTLPVGFVRDAFYNQSIMATPTVSSNASVDKALPAPQSIKQSDLDTSMITITFANKLDLDSARNINNYGVTGAAIKQIDIDKNTQDLAVVNIILQPGSIQYDANYSVTINGVRGYNNSYSAIQNFQQVVALRENVSPKVMYAKLNEQRDAITVTFDDACIGIAAFDIYVNGNCYKTATECSVVYGTYNEDSKYSLTIYFGPAIQKGSAVYLTPAKDNTLMDKNGNKAQINSMVFVN